MPQLLLLTTKNHLLKGSSVYLEGQFIRKEWRHDVKKYKNCPTLNRKRLSGTLPKFWCEQSYFEIWNSHVLLFSTRISLCVCGIIQPHIFMISPKIFPIKPWSHRFANNVDISLILTAMLMTAPSHMIVQWDVISRLNVLYLSRIPLISDAFNSSILSCC